MTDDHEPSTAAESEPPDADEEASLLELEALGHRCVRSLDRIVRMASRHPPPARDPAPSAPSAPPG
ncbi:hypothetical protein WMF30_10460 [Sorangium sp. So ce134]